MTDTSTDEDIEELHNDCMEFMENFPGEIKLCCKNNRHWIPWYNAEGLIEKLIAASKREKELEEIVAIFADQIEDGLRQLKIINATLDLEPENKIRKDFLENLQRRVQAALELKVS